MNNAKFLFAMVGVISACLALAVHLLVRAMRGMEDAITDLQRKVRDVTNDTESLGDRVDFLSREIDHLSGPTEPEKLRP